MNKGVKKLVLFVVSICLILSGCQFSYSHEDWGSFTPEKTYSYDNKYYAIEEDE